MASPSASSGQDIVVGVDIEPQPDYPGTFLQADVLSLPKGFLDGFDLVWASPPCQAYSATKNFHKNQHPDLIEPTRQLLADHPRTVIENVPEAPLRVDLRLECKDFGIIKTRRPRIFEISFECAPPPSLDLEYNYVVAAVGDGCPNKILCDRRKSQGLKCHTTVAEIEDCFNIHHIKTGTMKQRRHALNQCIPPIYAWWIAKD